MLFWSRLCNDWYIFLEKRVSAESLEQTLEQNSFPFFSFYFMLVLATAIATFGLWANSTATIIGAMIIAPMMNPILSLSYAIISVNRTLLLRSLFTLFTGIILTVLVAFLSTKFIGLRIVGMEIITRTNPSLLDLGVAMAAGAAAAFAYTRRSIGNALPGVAISVALVPPLSVVGIGLCLGKNVSADVGLYLATGNLEMGSLLLFLTNLAGIVFCSGLVFLLQSYGNLKKSILGFFTSLLMLFLLTLPLGFSLRKIWIKSTAIRMMARMKNIRPDLFPGTSKISRITAEYRDNLLHLEIEVIMNVDLIPLIKNNTNFLQKSLSESLGEPLSLKVIVIPVNIFEYEVSPNNLKAVKNQY